MAKLKFQPLLFIVTLPQKYVAFAQKFIFLSMVKTFAAQYFCGNRYPSSKRTAFIIYIYFFLFFCNKMKVITVSLDKFL